MIAEAASGLTVTIECVHISRCSMDSIIFAPSTRCAKAGSRRVTAQAAIAATVKIKNASVVSGSVSRKMRG